VTIEEQIKQLTAKWYEYVGSGHHKDRDCHFCVQMDYQYDGELVITATHYGYIGKEFDLTAETIEQAHYILLTAMQEMIAEEAPWVRKVLAAPERWDQDQRDQATAFQRLWPELLQGGDV
jgi:hypothetical protein